MRTIRDEDESGAAFEDVTVKHATAKALLCDIDGEEYWVPLSVLHDDSEIYVDEEKELQGSPGKLVVKPWWAKEKGLA